VGEALVTVACVPSTVTVSCATVALKFVPVMVTVCPSTRVSGARDAMVGPPLELVAFALNVAGVRPVTVAVAVS
jgi:hypothetical protein